MASSRAAARRAGFLFSQVDDLSADDPFVGQVVLAAAVPEELADQAAVDLGEAAEG
jgi:hypothetical protein